VSLFPEYSRLYFSGDREKLKRLVVKFSGLFLGLSTVVCIVLWFNSDLIIKIIFGERFLPASDVLRIMILSIFIIYVMIPVYFLPAAVGNAGPALKSATAATCVQMIFMFYLVPRYGALGAAWANVVYNIVWFAILLPSILAVLRHSTDELKIRN
jgi:O-antigen/teichoic acid export membrane protein